MTFTVTADAYTRFMGRFSVPLAGPFLDAVQPPRDARVLDVGCGPGALTALLAERLGESRVAAVDPVASFVAAVHETLPAVDARQGKAERLPFDDDVFDLALAQLVVHFLDDPVLGLREMARVTRPGGTVAATVWDHAGGTGPLATYWSAVAELDPSAPDESALAGTREGELARLLEDAGLRAVEPATIAVRVGFDSFEDWWEPYTLGVGPAGAYVAGLDDVRRGELRALCARRLPAGPFTVAASAWCARGVVGG